MTARSNVAMNKTLEADSADGAARLTDPDRLLTDWQQLLATKSHIHPPEVARLLDVPESALVACRIGSGAFRLNLEIQSLLAPASHWDKVLCAFANQCGHHMPLEEVRVEVKEGKALFIGDGLSATVDVRAIKDAYLFVDSDDGHGTTRSLQFFDATGRPIVKVLILHKTAFADAEQHFEQHRADNQSRMVTLSFADKVNYDSQAASLQADPDEAMLTDAIPALIQGEIDPPGNYTVELVADFARVIWSGALSKVRIDEKMFHFHEKNLRSHFYLGSIRAVKRSQKGGLVFDGDCGRMLRIIKREMP